MNLKVFISPFAHKLNRMDKEKHNFHEFFYLTEPDNPKSNKKAVCFSCIRKYTLSINVLAKWKLLDLFDEEALEAPVYINSINDKFELNMILHCYYNK